MRKAKPHIPPPKPGKSFSPSAVRQSPASRPPKSAWTESGRDAGIGELINIVYRRKWLIVSAVLAGLLLVGVVLQFLTPRYQAQTLLLMEPQHVTIPTVDSILSGRNADDQGVRSQVEVLRSRGLAAAMIKRLELDQDPEFNSRLRPPGMLDSLMTAFRPVEAASDGANHTGVVNSFLKRLDVEAVRDSRVLSVVFTSTDPEKAAMISNTLADQYLLSQLESKFEATRMANSWLNERVGELREQVAGSEIAVETFRRNAGLLQTQGVTLTAQQIAELNGQLVMARAAEAEAQARLQQLSNLINSPNGVSSASEVLNSPLIQHLKEQQSQVERRVAELSVEYGPLHPTMIQLQAEAQDLTSKIDSEVNKVVQNLSNEVAIASARETSLESELARLKEAMAESNNKQVQLRALEREAEANRALLATLLARYKEISSQDEILPQQADARIISRADAPTKPSFPNKTFAFGIVIPLAGLLALIVVFTLETLQRGFLSGHQIEDETGVTSLGFVPLLLDKGPDLLNPVDYILKRPRSALSQALRTAYWSLSMATPSIGSIVVTSSSQGEGKTTIALGLARTQAISGRKTLLIDADNRNPGIHTALNLPPGPGLMEFLGENSPLTIINDEPTGLDIITAGAPSEDPLRLLDSKTMDKFLGRMTREYDLVVIDTPPVLAAMDACALGRKTDATLLVVRWSETSQEVVIHTLRELARTSGHLAGVLLNMVDVRQHAKYQYGDSGAYHGTLRRYYSE